MTIFPADYQLAFRLTVQKNFFRSQDSLLFTLLCKNPLEDGIIEKSDPTSTDASVIFTPSEIIT